MGYPDLERKVQASRYMSAAQKKDVSALAYDKAALELYGEKAQLNHSLEKVLAWVPPQRRLRKTNTSGYRGIKQVGKRWAARLHALGKSDHIGMFDSPEEAARAYDRAAKVVYGERAILNFPEEEDGDDSV